MIDPHREPPADWPKLTEHIVPLSFVDTQKVCGGNLLLQTFACVRIHFDKGTCIIYTATHDAEVLEHERWHCQGYDHYGVSTLRDGWHEYKRTKQ